MSIKALSYCSPVSEPGWWGAIAPTLRQLFQQSPNTYLVVRYRVLDPAHGLSSGIALDISGEITSVEAEYKAWTQTRTGPLFGSHADAKVLDVAATLGGPAPTLAQARDATVWPWPSGDLW